MSLFLLDSDVVIDVLKLAERTITFLEGLDKDDVLAVTGPVVAEVVSGVLADQREVIRAILLDYAFLDTPREAAYMAGELRHDLLRRGRTLSAPDALIAATAIHHGATLVTRNTRDFGLLNVDLVSPT